MNLIIKEEYLKEIRSIIFRIYPNAIIFAYGSRVNGNARNGSDLDLSVKSFGQKDYDINKLKVAFRESDIPFFVQVNDFNKISKSFQEDILKNYIVIEKEEAIKKSFSNNNS